ncbi:MAG: ATPase [Deltaproteobacteria bacterium RIFOXYB12_FULL_58_9]|nr:MAG: ATPase [Deltaproteobacteria bacterium RIFOXYB12_FULL_58_9]
MPIIEGIRIQNYRALRDLTLGCLWNQKKNDPLRSLVAVIGKNGSGKSTLFDAFGFLSDCLSLGVEEACDARQRGGLSRLLSAGQTGPIRFEIYYRESAADRPITYELSIGADKKGRPYVQRECLRQWRKKQGRSGQPFAFLILDDGKGLAWSGEETFEGEDAARVPVELTDNRKLAIATRGALKEHPRITRFRNFIQGWYLSYFTPDAARGLPLAGPQKHLNIHGDNIGNVVQFMEREHPQELKEVLSRIGKKIPGIRSIDTKPTEDKRLLLRFNDGPFRDPFLAQQMSDGTLKMFAYLLLLEDPEPAPFICIEEPENGLYHKLLEALATEFRAHANGKKPAPQIFLTTHQPYLVNALAPDEVWILEKGADGFSTVRRAADDATVRELVAEGLPLGNLWYSDYLDPRS